MSDEIFTVLQAAQYLKVSEKTIRRLIKSKKLIASRVGSRSLRIRQNDIDQYLANHTNHCKGAVSYTHLTLPTNSLV